jgi:hypothetical protein
MRSKLDRALAFRIGGISEIGLGELGNSVFAEHQTLTPGVQVKSGDRRLCAPEELPNSEWFSHHGKTSVQCWRFLKLA